MQKVLRLLALVLILSSVLTSAPSSAEAATKKAKLNMRKLDMTVGDSFQLRVYNMKKKQKAVYVSTDSNVLSVDSVNASSKRATITAVAIGSANINVTIKKGRRVIKQLKCRVKISPNAVSIKFPKKTVKLQPTEQFQLDPIIKPITSTEQPVFESDDTSVATVSSRGTVTALSPGIVTITATLLSTNQTAECKIIVSVPNETTEKPEQNEKKRSLDNLFFSC